MAWIPTSLSSEVCRRLLPRKFWRHCFRPLNSRPIPSLSLYSEDEDEIGKKKAVAAFVRAKRPKPEPIPAALSEAVAKVLEDFSVTALQKDAKSLNHYLAARHPPTEDSVVQATAHALEGKYISEHADVSEQKLKQYVVKTLKNRIYHWRPLAVSSAHEAAVYLVARLADEYAGVLYCLRQVARAEPGFSPHAVLNDGSAAGAGLWAARRLWAGAVREYVGVEWRLHLLELAARLVQGGRADGPTDPAVFFRPLLPGSTRLKYPLVVSSHALIELASQQERLERVASLWERTAPGGRLLVLEAGNNAGFQLVLEARDLVLRLARRPDAAAAYVEAPCPHEAVCPRFSHSLTPCHFSVPHAGLGLAGGTAAARPQRAKLSYVILRKAALPAEEERWPRVVQPVLERPRHIICRLCTARGKLEEIVVTKRRHGAELYRCAKASRWGDTLPVRLRDAGEEG